MRTVLLLLLLANLFLYLWHAGLLGTLGSQREPERLAQQLQPEALRLLPPGPPAPPVPVCRRIEGLSDEVVQSMRDVWSRRAGVRELAVTDQTPSEYRVMIPGLASAAAATKKQTELRALGVAEMKTLPDTDNGPFLISLGSYGDEARAQRALEELGSKGVRSARLVARKLGAEQFAVTLSLEAAQAEALARELGNWLQAREGSSAGAVVSACPDS
jgi:hypothetical protein